MPDFISQMSNRTRLTVVASALAVIVVFYGLYSLSSQTSYALLANQLNASESAAIASSLQSHGISFKYADAGSTIEVDSSKVDAARALLASNNLLNGGHVGWSIFDKSSLGATDAQQQADYQQAIDGQVAMALEQIAGIQSATVNIAIPKTQVLFSTEQQPTTASVLLQLDSGTTLTGDQVHGIANLVASSVDGLTANNVVITDQNGNLLNGGSTPGAIGGSDGDQTKLAAQTQYDSQVGAQLQAMLNQALGANMALVQVNTDLDWNSAQLQSETYAKKGVPAQTTTTKESFKGTGTPPAGGVAGTGTNIPSYATTGAAAGGNSNYLNTQEQQQYDVSKTIANTTIAPGEIKRQTVSVLVDSSVPAAEVLQLKNAIASAVGFDPTRGDVINIARIKFATPATTAAAAKGGLSSMLGLAKEGGLIIAAIIVLLLFLLGARRREKSVFTGEIEIKGLPVKTGGAVPSLDEMNLSADASSRTQMHQRVEELVDKDPDEAARFIRQLLAD